MTAAFRVGCTACGDWFETPVDTASPELCQSCADEFREASQFGEPLVGSLAADPERIADLLPSGLRNRLSSVDPQVTVNGFGQTTEEAQSAKRVRLFSELPRQSVDERIEAVGVGFQDDSGHVSTMDDRSEDVNQG